MKPLAKLCLRILAVLLVAALPAAAGIGVWTPLGPDGGQVTVLAVAPYDPDLVYAGTPGSGIFKSTDGGAHWSAGRGLGTASVSALAVDPVRHGTVYAAALREGVFKSTDGGATWVRMWTPPPMQGSLVSTYALVLDPRRPDTLFAGTSTGVYRSSDGGATWSLRGRLGDTFSLALDSAGGWLYASGYGVFRSFDQGKTWEPASDGLPWRPWIERIALDPDRPKLLFATTSLGLHRSFDRGKSWVPAGESPRDVTAIVFPRRGQVYVATHGDGLLRSADAGSTWQRTQTDTPTALRSFGTLAAGPATLYAGVPGGPVLGGLFRSLDAGATWQRSDRGLHAVSAGPVAVDPSDSRKLFVAVDGDTLFRSTDRGATWTFSYSGAMSIADILLDPARPGRVYLAVLDRFNGPLARSDDGGATWRPANGATVPILWDLALDRRSPDALWGLGSIDEVRGLFHSSDGGITWERVESLTAAFGLFLDRVEVDPRDPSVVYVGGGEVAGTRPVLFAPRLYRSDDGGETWERRDAGLTSGRVRDIAVDATSPSTVYAVTERLFRSTDAGHSWNAPAGARGLSYVSVTAVPGTPAAVYAARQFPPAVLRSTDQGATWTVLRRGPGGYVPLVVEVPSNAPAQLYLGTVNGGLMTYTLEGTP